MSFILRGIEIIIKSNWILISSFDSSVGRAEDCRRTIDILRSLVRIRLQGIFLLLFVSKCSQSQKRLTRFRRHLSFQHTLKNCQQYLFLNRPKQIFEANYYEISSRSNYQRKIGVLMAVYKVPYKLANREAVLVLYTPPFSLRNGVSR